jgi:Leucine-rich repeat (LRR) protein
MALRPGFYYAIASVPLMGAGVFGPDVLHLSQPAKKIAFYLCLAAAVLLLIVGAAKEYKDELRASRSLGHGRRVIAILGMLICGVGFLGFAAAYFWHSAARSPDSTAVAQLAELGWGVQPQKDGIRFELSSRPLPSMGRSAELFHKVGVQFSIQLQGLPSLDGLHYLSGTDELNTLGISAGTFNDISEIKDLRSLTELSISQTPIDGRNAVDASPLADLLNLRKLNLYATKIVTVIPLRNLIKLHDLYLRDTWVSDLSPISSLQELESLDVTDIRCNDLTPLKQNTKLAELGVGVSQIPSLVNLADLPKLSKLRIIAQGNVDLRAVGTLSNLEYLWVWAGVSRFDVAPLHNLTKLRDLTLSVLGIGRVAPVDNIGALGDLTELRRITISDLQITDLEFLKNANHLEEINLSELPISSLEPLGGLKELKSVSINALPIVDISPLMDLPELTQLRIMRTPARADMLSALQRRGVKVQSD